MAYKHKGTLGSPLLSVEQARRRNAELRIELEALTAEHAALEPQVEAMRQKVAEAYAELTPSKPARAKPGTGSSHGTARKFDEGCRCDRCAAAKKEKRARYNATLAARKAAA